MHTHKTLTQNYNGGYALHHTRVHTLLRTPYPAREGMRVWGMEHPRYRLAEALPCRVFFGVSRLYMSPASPPASYDFLGIPLYPCIYLYLAILQQIH